MMYTILIVHNTIINQSDSKSCQTRQPLILYYHEDTLSTINIIQSIMFDSKVVGSILYNASNFSIPNFKNIITKHP